VRDQKIRVVIVDDEEQAIHVIRLLLDPYKDVDIIGTATDGYEAINCISKLRPDLVFLDIQMPEVDGFDVIRQVSATYQPYYIFTTAYDRYAVEAFEVHALDYLLKPFTDERFRQTIDRARNQIRNNKDGSLAMRLEALMADHQSSLASNALSKLSIKTNGKTIFIDTQEISWIEADNQYVQIHVTGKKYIVRESLSSIERRLGTSTFYRVHRSTIINVHYVEAIEPHFKGDCVVFLKGGVKVRLSRKRKDGLKTIIGW